MNRSQYTYIDIDKIVEVTEGSSELIKDMAAIFARQVPEYNSQLDFLLRANDLKALGKLAHKIKGTVALLGITQLVNTMKELEKLTGQNAKQQELEQNISKFKNLSTFALDELSDYLKRIKT